MSDKLNAMLGAAIGLAVKCHHNQYDRGGKPYILHPMHLMSQLMFDTELAIIAVLHDSVEDSGLTIDGLKQLGYSDRVCKAIDLLTHKDGDDYLSEYIANIATNYDALRVKRKDLEHNSDITRLKGVSMKDLERMRKYHTAFIMLGNARKVFQ